jgi:hypothetical protein
LQVYWQTPLAQLAVLFAIGAQVPHSEPPAPQELADCVEYGTHVPPTVAVQHPLGHDVASHTHVPLLLSHSCPLAQPPHVAPPVPHEPLLWVLHSSQVPVAPPTQQPPAHELASHVHCPVVLLHSRLVPHAWHATPPAPHEVFDSLDRASHVVPLQQPAHAIPPQLHVPFEQADPLLQAAQFAPPVPHDVVD